MLSLTLEGGFINETPYSFTAVWFFLAVIPAAVLLGYIPALETLVAVAGFAGIITIGIGIGGAST